MTTSWTWVRPIFWGMIAVPLVAAGFGAMLYTNAFGFIIGGIVLLSHYPDFQLRSGELFLRRFAAWRPCAPAEFTRVVTLMGQRWYVGHGATGLLKGFYLDSWFTTDASAVMDYFDAVGRPEK